MRTARRGTSTTLRCKADCRSFQREWRKGPWRDATALPFLRWRAYWVDPVVKVASAREPMTR